MTLFEAFFLEMYENSSLGYNLVKLNDSELLLELNVAGIPDSDVDVEVSGNRLNVSAKSQEDNRDYFHKGIHTKSIKTSFSLRDGLVVKSATVKYGILSIQLEYEIPENKKPRKILLTN